MSGISYLGPSSPGAHRFLVVQEDSGQLAAFDLAFDPVGEIASVDAFESISIGSTLDFEGIARVDSQTAFLSEEDSPGIRRFSLVDGNELQSTPIPPVFAHRRSNRGFESLALSADGDVLWTANEEALVVDGPAATTVAGTTVRLARFEVEGDDVVATLQYAYESEPIHAAGLLSTQQSGLVELTLLPDGTLLALERSFALAASPAYVSRMFAIDLGNATDVSAAPLDEGLTGRSFTPADKELLWEGVVDGAAGQNLEGLALGPQLDDGDWVLVGVVDGGDPFSADAIVTFRLQFDATELFDADFDSSGAADGADFLLWQRGLGRGPGASLLDGDGNGDGVVNANDLAGWEAAVIATNAFQDAAVPEPRGAALMFAALLTALVGRSAHVARR